MKAVADEAVALAPSVRRVIVVRRLGDRAPSTPWDAGRDRWWDEAIDAARARATATRRGRDRSRRHDPETPVHADLHVGHDRPARRAPSTSTAASRSRPPRTSPTRSTCGRGDGLFWFTDLGWMMGPWAISGSLLLGARLVLYEGAPDYPGPDRIWEPRRAPPGHPPRPVPDGRPGPDPARHRAGPGPRPREPPRPRLDRRAVGPGDLVVALPRGRRRAAARSSTTRAGRRSRGGIVGCNLLTPDQAGVVQRAVPGHGRGRRRSRRAVRSAATSASS